MSVPLAVSPERPFNIRYADEALLVVEKPAGIVTEPGRGHSEDTLLNGLFHQYRTRLQRMWKARDWGLLHRLDRLTSGLLLVALKPEAYDALRTQFENHRVRKRYWALVAGVPPRKQGTVQQPLREIKGVRKRAVIGRDGKPATTAYRLLSSGTWREPRGRKRETTVSLLEIRPATGRLHQVRVHMSHLGCPVLGDTWYGEQHPGPRMTRLGLHAAELSFVHPNLKRRLVVRAPWPEDLRSVLARCGLTEPML